MIIRILSFNVLAQNWIDVPLRRAAEQKKHLERRYRVERHIEVFKESCADVFLLQEVTPIMMSYYQEALPDFDEACFARMFWQPAQRGHPINGNAILWRKGLFSGSPMCERIELERTLGNYAAMVSGVLAQVRRQIRFINLHLEYGDPQTAAQQFRQIFERRFVHNHKRVIIGGDFNMGGSDDASFPIIADIDKQGFIDCAPNLPTHPFKDESQTITHVLVRGVESVQDTGIVGRGALSIGECLRLYGSDHFPVLVTVSI